MIIIEDWGGVCRACEAVFVSIAHRLSGLFIRILRCFPLRSTKDRCGKSPCLRVKILAIRRTPLTKTASKKLHKAWPDGGTFMQKRREML